MIARGLPLNRVIYTTVIDFFATRGLAKQAEQLFSTLERYEEEEKVEGGTRREREREREREQAESERPERDKEIEWT